MRRVATALNEQQYKVLTKTLEQLNVTEYELTKRLLLEFLESGNIDTVKLRLLTKKIADAVAKDIQETQLL